MFTWAVNAVSTGYLRIMRTARSILEAEMDTLVIHMDDRSTDFLKPIYEGHGYPVITGAITDKEARAAIQEHARIYMLGHGGPMGLFTRGFMADDSFGPLLAAKDDGLYIWCNADAYAVRNKLTGLVSGMFISEVGEAAYYGIRVSQDEVDMSNALFSKVLREILDQGAPHAEITKRYTHGTSQVVKFNQERLYVFHQGNPSPALHPSSAHIKQLQRDKEDAEWREKHKNDPEFTKWEQPSWGDAFIKEITGIIEGGVDAVLKGEYSPEQVAEEIARHTPGGEDYIEHVAAILQDMLDQGTDPHFVVQQILDQVGW